MPKYKAPAPPEIDVGEFRKVITSRRSVRRFTDEKIPSDVIDDCLDMAILAPNSSNLQPWTFYVVRSADKKRKMAEACLGQNAAKTADVMIAVIARTRTWRRNSARILKEWPGGNPPTVVKQYYAGVTHIQYTQGPLDALGRAKRAASRVAGLVQPVPRGPSSHCDMRVWAAKSSALAAENLMLALRAHGYDSCPMEGFDEARVKRILKYPGDGFPIMIIGAGKRAEDGIYHETMRFKREDCVIEI